MPGTLLCLSLSYCLETLCLCELRVRLTGRPSSPASALLHTALGSQHVHTATPSCYHGAVIQTQGLMLAQCSDLPTQLPSPKLLKEIILQRLYEIGHIKACSTSTPKKQEDNKYPLKSKTKYLLKQSVIHSLVLKCLGI